MRKRQCKADGLRMKGRAAVLLPLCAFVSTMAQADVIRIGTKSQSGTLEAYDGRSFQFRDEGDGKVQNVPRTSVKDLKLDEPRKAEVVQMGKATEEMLMAGYAKGMFLFMHQGRKEIISGMKVTNIKLATVSRFGGSSEPTPGAMQLVSDADIETLLVRPDLNADQEAALDQYQAAKDKYRQFVNESSALVARMEMLKGSDRQAVLNDLRLRKEAEQPLKSELAASWHALSAAFPELLSAE